MTPSPGARSSSRARPIFTRAPTCGLSAPTRIGFTSRVMSVTSPALRAIGSDIPVDSSPSRAATCAAARLSPDGPKKIVASTRSAIRSGYPSPSTPSMENNEARSNAALAPAGAPAGVAGVLPLAGEPVPPAAPAPAPRPPPAPAAPVAPGAPVTSSSGGVKVRGFSPERRTLTLTVGPAGGVRSTIVAATFAKFSIAGCSPRRCAASSASSAAFARGMSIAGSGTMTRRDLSPRRSRSMTMAVAWADAARAPCAARYLVSSFCT